jgi:DNA polymerase-3 subunit beta
MTKATETALTIERAKLLREVELCASVAAKNDTIPITRCVLIVGDPEGLRLAATDCQHTIMTRLEIGIDEPFAAVVDATLLSRVLRSMPADDVQLTIAANAITVTSGLSVVELPVIYDTGLFPTLPGALDELFTMPLGLVQRLFRSVEFAMTDLESQSNLHGVYMMAGKKSIDFAATDGHMLAMATAGTPRGKECSLFVAKRAVQAVMKLEGESVSIGLTENESHIGFMVGDRCLYTLREEFRPLDFRGQFPKTRPSVLLIDREEFMAALRRVLVVADGTKPGARAVRLDFAAKKSRIGIAPMQPSLGRAADAIPADFAKWNRDQFMLGLDTKYLLPALESIDSAQVRVELPDDGDGLMLPVVMPAEQPELFEQMALVCPTRL